MSQFGHGEIAQGGATRNFDVPAPPCVAESFFFFIFSDFAIFDFSEGTQQKNFFFSKKVFLRPEVVRVKFWHVAKKVET